MTSWVKLSKLPGAALVCRKSWGRKIRLLVSNGTCVILSGLAVRHPRRVVFLLPVSVVVREVTSPAPRSRRCSGIAWCSDYVFPRVFVLAALLAVAASSLDLLVWQMHMSSKICRKAEFPSSTSRAKKGIQGKRSHFLRKCWVWIVDLKNIAEWLFGCKIDFDTTDNEPSIVWYTGLIFFF